MEVDSWAFRTVGGNAISREAPVRMSDRLQPEWLEPVPTTEAPTCDFVGSRPPWSTFRESIRSSSPRPAVSSKSTINIPVGSSGPRQTPPCAGSSPTSGFSRTDCMDIGLFSEATSTYSTDAVRTSTTRGDARPWSTVWWPSGFRSLDRRTPVSDRLGPGLTKCRGAA